jgi:flagellar hook-associated protein 1 FlgK
MRSTFYGLEIARSGMNVQQIGLDVTSHNIANANIQGYSRQQAIIRTIGPASGAVNKWVSKNTGQMAGMGAAVQEIRQIRDTYLDNQYRKENKRLGEWEAKQQALSHVEAIFNEPSDTGINTVLNEFFDALQAMSLNPEDPTTRATVQQKGYALTENIREVYKKLEELQRQLDDGILAYVQEINSYAQEISEINKLIFEYEASGHRANDLRDQRELLLDQLSSIVDVTSYEGSDGRFRVDIGGQMLVNHFDVNA